MNRQLTYPGILLIVVLIIFFAPMAAGQPCNQQYNWTTWQTFTGTTATGTINNNGQLVHVTMRSNFNFTFTNSIFGYANFSGFPGGIPNSKVPATTWSAGAGGTTTMCFDQVVKNPVLVFSSLGAPGVPVTLHFSVPYQVAYKGVAMTYVNDTTVIGAEGYTVLLFPGDFSCLTIFSTTPENYTNITWGLNPPLFPVTITGGPAGCDSVLLSASGGVKYHWTGGKYPDSANNTFSASGTYILTVTDANGCTVTTSRTVTVTHASHVSINMTICEGSSFAGHTTSGQYSDTLVAANGCDSIRTLNLTVTPKAHSNVLKTICAGDTYIGHSASGSYILDTLVAANGCDSIRTLQLTVLTKSFSAISQVICKGESYLGHNTTGTYTDVLTAANGCDSVRTLHLTVTSFINTTVNLTICQGQSYAGHSATGTYTDTLPSTGSCDSIRLLNLTVSPVLRTIMSATICEGGSLLGHTSSGTYTDTLKDRNGCDSIVQLTLGITTDCVIHFPNAFTPNGDGKDDSFRALASIPPDNYLLTIYNRWGQKVFETTDYRRGWDGMIHQRPADQNGYVYVCRYRLKGQDRQASGLLMLLR